MPKSGALQIKVNNNPFLLVQPFFETAKTVEIPGIYALVKPCAAVATYIILGVLIKLICHLLFVFTVVRTQINSAQLCMYFVSSNSCYANGFTAFGNKIDTMNKKSFFFCHLTLETYDKPNNLFSNFRNHKIFHFQV